MHRFTSPRGGLSGSFQNGLVRARWIKRLRRLITQRLPFPVLASDVCDVVYLNWVIDAERARIFVPPGVDLIEDNGQVVFTVLTYTHGHFGPAIFGPLRRFFGSPLQSNWRLYVDRVAREPATATVLFIANVFDSTLYTVATRLFSDALPSDLAGRFVHCRVLGGIETVIEGDGSAPTLRATLRDTADRSLPTEFVPLFGDWMAAVRSLCLQDRAVCSIDDLPGRVALASIDLPIDMATVEPLTCVEESHGGLLERLGVEGLPFCFRVPAVPFRVTSEQLIDVR